MRLPDSNNPGKEKVAPACCSPTASLSREDSTCFRCNETNFLFFTQDAFSGCQILPCSHKVHKECAIAMIQNGV